VHDEGVYSHPTAPDQDTVSVVVGSPTATLDATTIGALDAVTVCVINDELDRYGQEHTSLMEYIVG
jgi:hypothetical protein